MRLHLTNRQSTDSRKLSMDKCDDPSCRPIISLKTLLLWWIASASLDDPFCTSYCLCVPGLKSTCIRRSPHLADFFSGMVAWHLHGFSRYRVSSAWHCFSSRHISSSFRFCSSNLRSDSSNLAFVSNNCFWLCEIFFLHEVSSFLRTIVWKQKQGV